MSAPIPAARFVAALDEHGIARATGVPCGHLAGPWKLFDDRRALTVATSEGAALALAAGWELAGERSVVLCQNSGFGNLLNPLTSLVLAYRLPVLVVMTLRGWPDATRDEPQHSVMGASTTQVLDALNVAHTVLEPDNLSATLAMAARERAARRPFFVLVPMGMIGKAPFADAHASANPPPVGEEVLTRPAVVTALMAELTDQALVTTTGFLSRQARHEQDRPSNFYMQGSMGHAVAIGLGLATANRDRTVVVLDGDGAFLMHLGTGATVGASGTRRLVHFVVDNGCYESTGCQRTCSAAVDWTALGRGLGYRTVLTCDTRSQLVGRLRSALRSDGPVLCVLSVVPTPGETHPRATSSTTLDSIAERFQQAFDRGSRVSRTSAGAVPA